MQIAGNGENVWEFYNPHRANHDPELIATLFELVRLPRDFAEQWITETPAGSTN